ncbi:hypothetical protein FA15DRAFT_321885 [Coprinopsis marcescibilis]|uniref:Sacsin/Nov domain-containing protein n=1 Tax=Coprinopsis marcescibilis TaxID=230819 RepID=A0A5C3KC14_COPMA|nr:hypothetical protein FA15DRAFT_321885 [Coprinopsis marcescibilis]
MVSKVVWARGEERVEVNQRALIDKVLARYSGEFTVFRELLQNSDDARAKAVQIHFLTRIEEKSTDLDADLKDLKKIIISRWKFQNNGEVFHEEGWARSKKIAEGNPDEGKIGAFGVGFYSVFSVTEEPIVTSGGSCMKFFWKDNKDQLCVVRGNFPKDNVLVLLRQLQSTQLQTHENQEILNLPSFRPLEAERSIRTCQKSAGWRTNRVMDLNRP